VRAWEAEEDLFAAGPVGCSEEGNPVEGTIRTIGKPAQAVIVVRRGAWGQAMIATLIVPG